MLQALGLPKNVPEPFGDPRSGRLGDLPHPTQADLGGVEVDTEFRRAAVRCRKNVNLLNAISARQISQKPGDASVCLAGCIGQ